MKIALTATGNSVNGSMESRFGRAQGFIIYDSDRKESEFLDNTVNMNSAQGAGIQSAMNLIKAGVQTVITGHCGPKAFHLLKNAGIAIFLTEAHCVSEAIGLFESNSLKILESPDVNGHWK
jgi:predicted Fe-Mo cluster-binding NifX family protein